MAYTADFALALGPSYTGIADLRAQIVDTAGANTGGAISTGFVEVGNGFYNWVYASFPDGHRGGVKFYSAATPATFLAYASINPEELENVDAKVSTRATAATASLAVEALIASGIYTWGDMMRLLGGTQGGLTAGALTGTFTIQDVSNTKPMVVATIDANGNRTAIALDLTP